MAEKLTPGMSVTVKQQLRSTGDKTWSKMFIGRTGDIAGKCGLFRNAYTVRFAEGLTASYYADELLVERRGRQQ